MNAAPMPNTIDRGATTFPRVATVAVALTLLAAGAAAHAAPPGFYVGAGVGRAEDKLLDDADTAWKLNGGYRFGAYFALEAGYIDLGDTTDNVAGIDFSSSQDGFAGYLVGLLPLGDALALFGKLGAFAYDVDLDFGGDKATESGTELAYGAGLRYDFANGLGLLGEWERFDDVAGGDFDLFSVGLSYTF